MYSRPDYSTARQNAGFGWSVSGSQGALREVTQTPIREFNLKPEACIEAYRKGRPILREMFGEDVRQPGVATPAVSYGHVNGLGSELLFPEGGEVAHTHIYGSLEEGIRRLKEPVDWATAGMLPFFLEFRERMREAFPDEHVGFSCGAEGPITTAYELRGDGFFLDIMDGATAVAVGDRSYHDDGNDNGVAVTDRSYHDDGNGNDNGVAVGDRSYNGGGAQVPALQEFLRAVVGSILEYNAWVSSLDGRPGFNEHGAGMVDDIASFVPPRVFREITLPAWERYYSGLTSGTRSAHVEDLRPEQLPFLEEIGLSHYDPSISPRLNPQIIRDHCRVPFEWRLESFHCWEMSVQEVEDFVYQSAADGANGVTVALGEGLCDERAVAQIGAFIRAAKDAKRLLEEGCSREEIGERVSAEGKEKLWEGWCGFLSPKSSRGGAR